MDQVSKPIKILGIITLLAGGWFFISNGSSDAPIEDLDALAAVAGSAQSGTYQPSTSVGGGGSGGGGSTQSQIGMQKYSPALVESAGDAKVLLLFTGSGCSSCQTVKNNINANKFLIPEELRILEVDFNRNPDLAEEFKVGAPGRLVLINSSWGWQKSFGASSLEQILNILGM